MAEIAPLQAIHYNRRKVPSLDQVVAPPYDVIDAQQRQLLAARSPYNIVAIDLPKTPPDPYAAAGQLFSSWLREGILERDEQPAIWPHEQEYTGPDGVRRRRRGFFARIRLEGYGPGKVRPHERTHPAAKQDRLRLTRATRANLSPIFTLYSDPAGEVLAPLVPHLEELPFAEVRDPAGTVHRLWRVADPRLVAALPELWRDRELLIADGHHRYETALTYAGESGGLELEGPHRYVLACLVALEDPGLTVFPIHRLVAAQPEAATNLQRFLASSCAVEPIGLTALEQRTTVPATGFGFGLLTEGGRSASWVTVDPNLDPGSAFANRSDAYRQLTSALLEEVVLKRTLGLAEETIERLEGFGYANSFGDALAALEEGTYSHAFILRPTPVEQVAAIANAGEYMPPKSTFFYPKLLTGLLINPLW